MPNSDEDYHRVINDPKISRAAQYGAVFIDRIIKEEQPDIYIGVEDIWAFNDYWNKKWWNKIPCVIWTTLDSLPILKMAKENAPKIKSYWVWADFARKALHEFGHTHVKTVHGAFDVDSFRPLTTEERKAARDKYGIDDDTLVFGFVFRNQLRKLVLSLIEGFAEFKRRHPDKKVKLILHTNWDEGWNIQEFLEEKGWQAQTGLGDIEIDPNDIITTYVCGNCKRMSLQKYEGQGAQCGHCGQKNLVSPRTIFGCSEEELNEIYNLMDGYIHPMTSGGLEMPIVEALLAGVPVATVPYSCGTEFTDAGVAYPLRFDTYREISSNFIKATTQFGSIADFMDSMLRYQWWEGETLQETIKKGREWAIKEFTIENVGPQIEEFLDSQPEHNYDFKFELGNFDAEYPFPEIVGDVDFVLDLYRGVLGLTESPDSEAVIGVVQSLEDGKSRQQLYEEFINTAKIENERMEKMDYRALIDDNGKKRLALVIPGTIGDCFICLGILDSLRETYKEDEWDIYVSTLKPYAEVFAHIPYVKAILPYAQKMDNFKWWEGAGNHQGIVDVVLMPYMSTQRNMNYIHNGMDINELQS